MPQLSITRYKIKRIVEAVEAGNYMETAGSLIGISKAVLYKWMGRGRALRSALEAEAEQRVDAWAVTHQAAVNEARKQAGLPPEPGQEGAEEEEEFDTLAHIRPLGEHHPDWLCVELVDGIEKAKAAAECRAVALIAKAGHETWQANAWFLERTNFEKWGRRGMVQHVGPNGGPVQVQSTSVNIDVIVESMSDEELEGALKLVESLTKANADGIDVRPQRIGGGS